MGRPILIRGHHLLELARYIKERTMPKPNGHGRKFYNNAKKVFDTLISDPKQSVMVMRSPDDLCRYCKSKKSEECGKHSKLDERVAEFVGINTGTNYQTGYLIQMLEETDMEQFMRTPVTEEERKELSQADLYEILMRLA